MLKIWTYEIQEGSYSYLVDGKICTTVQEAGETLMWAMKRMFPGEEYAVKPNSTRVDVYKIS